MPSIECPKCNQPNDSDAAFCSGCGKRLRKRSEKHLLPLVALPLLVVISVLSWLLYSTNQQLALSTATVENLRSIVTLNEQTIEQLQDDPAGQRLRKCHDFYENNVVFVDAASGKYHKYMCEDLPNINGVSLKYDADQSGFVSCPKCDKQRTHLFD